MNEGESPGHLKLLQKDSPCELTSLREQKNYIAKTFIFFRKRIEQALQGHHKLLPMPIIIITCA